MSRSPIPELRPATRAKLDELRTLAGPDALARRTDVEPTWSMRSASAPSASRTRRSSAAYWSGHVGS